MLTTTLARIRAHNPCENGWEKLLKYLGKTKADDEPLPYSVIVESNGLEDALWCCRAEPEYDKEWRLFSVWCARQVQHLMKDKRSLNALDVSEKFANGLATEKELAVAEVASMKAAKFAHWNVAGAAARNSVMPVSWATPWASSWDSARASACDNGLFGDSWDSAWDAAREAQKKKFLEAVK